VSISEQILDGVSSKLPSSGQKLEDRNERTSKRLRRSKSEIADSFPSAALAAFGCNLAQRSALMEATHMKRIGILGATALFLLVGSTASAYAWQEPKDEKPKEEAKAKPPAKQQEAKPAKQEPQAKPAQHEEKAPTAKKQEPAKQEEKPAAKPARQEQQAKPAQHEEKAASTKQQAKPEEHGKSAGAQHAQRTPDEEKRQRAVPAVRLSVRTSVRIPDERFRANFGQEHVFVISEPVMVGGFSRFQYGGFSFGFIEPWPDGWYYTDDVYVDYIDGEYFLFNPYYPGVRVGISVVI
jgi:hypothetical protein